MKYRYLLESGPIPNQHPTLALTHEILSSHAPRTTEFPEGYNNDQSIHYTEGPHHDDPEAADDHLEHIHDQLRSIGWRRHSIESEGARHDDPMVVHNFSHPKLPLHSLYLERGGNGSTDEPETRYMVNAGISRKPY